MVKNMCPVVHFEMPYENRDRMVKFYQETFGWEIQILGPEMGNYVLVTTAKPNGAGELRKDIARGAIGGGFFPKDPSQPNQAPSLVIAVSDIRNSIQRVNQAGGKVLGPVTLIQGVGEYVSFLDTEGNRTSMLQPIME